MNEIWNLISPDAAWNALFEESPQALLVVETEADRVVTANAVAEKLYGFSPGTMQGVEATELVEPGDESVLSRLQSASTGVSYATGGRHRRQDGSTFHAHVHAAAIDAKNGALFLFTVVDRSEPDLIDAASGLPDPRLFIDRLEHSIAHAHRSGRGLGVCLLHIERLSGILDDLEAESASRLLHDLGDRLRANLRESDTVARVGRSEFALIVEGVVEQDALLDVLKKVLDDFEYEFSIGDEDVLLQPSVGVSVYPHDGHEPDMLVENAAIAARAVAEEGLSSVRFFEALHQ